MAEDSIDKKKADIANESDDLPHESEGASGSAAVESLLDIFAKKFGFSTSEDDDESPKAKPAQLLNEVSFDGIVQYIKEGKCKNIIVLTGAGISTSAGIPDFRSPTSGLYDNLEKFKLPHPQAIFEIGFFEQNPEPFYTLAKELYPGSFKPTPCHYFIRLLHEKGLLLRLYTQNIDTLERISKIPENKIVEAHGTFYTSHCLGRKCQKEYTLEWMKEKIFADEIPKCTDCNSLIKPDIVFFGESLPERFYNLIQKDFPKCDMLIVMGTSLLVQPFASLVDRVPDSTPRLLINKEKSGESDMMMRLLGLDDGMKFDSEDNYRDVAWLGLCDDGCHALAAALGWADELKELVELEQSVIEKNEKEDGK